MLPRLQIDLPRCRLAPGLIAALTALSPAPPPASTPQHAVRTPTLLTHSLINKAIAQPHVWLHHRTGGGAPHPVSLVCTGPSNYRNFIGQNTLESTTEVKIRYPRSIQTQSKYRRKRPSGYRLKLSGLHSRQMPNAESKCRDHKNDNVCAVSGKKDQCAPAPLKFISSTVLSERQRSAACVRARRPWEVAGGRPPGGRTSLARLWRARARAAGNQGRTPAAFPRGRELLPCTA